jgi:hypothetical protein
MSIISKGFATAGSHENTTFYHANSTYEVTLHDLLQDVLLSHPGVPLTAFKLGVYQQREPRVHGCIVQERDERSFLAIEVVKGGSSE